MTLSEFIEEWNDDTPYIKVKTSGSTGKPKEMLVEKCRMKASAKITCDFLGLTSKDTALLCLPLDYIAGKMMVVRCLERGMKIVSVAPSSHPLKDLQEIPTFAAMVPMQVYNSMENEEERSKLMKIKNLIIGGGAVDSEMVRRLRLFGNTVWSTYGMTETLSHIALRKLSGMEATEYYSPFEGVELYAANDGCLCIKAPVVCKDTLKTNDIVEFHEDGRRFRVIGRKDNVIDSGGIKIQIEEIEQALKGRLNVDFAVSKMQDKEYGEIVVLFLALPEFCKNKDNDIFLLYRKGQSRSIKDMEEPRLLPFSASFLFLAISSLPKYWQPKAVFAVDKIPYTETGKIARASVINMLDNYRGNV